MIQCKPISNILAFFLSSYAIEEFDNSTVFTKETHFIRISHPCKLVNNLYSPNFVHVPYISLISFLFLSHN